MNTFRARLRMNVPRTVTIVCLLLCATGLRIGWAQDRGTRPAEDISERVAQLIRQLDSDSFSDREEAEAELGELGLPALSAVREAARQHRSAEVRRRARHLVALIERSAVTLELKRLAAQADDSAIDVEQGMLVICRIVDPLVDEQKVKNELDRLASQVREQLGKQVKPRDADPQQVVKALQEVLFIKHALAGNRANYDHPDNSSLARVLETRQGLPIILAHLTVAVGNRLDLPLVGLPVPSHYMLKYDGSRAAAGFPKQDIFLDAYDGGRKISRQDVEELITRRGFKFDPDQHLQPSTNRAVLVRMLANLSSDYAEVGQLDKAQRVDEYRTLVAAESDEP